MAEDACSMVIRALHVLLHNADAQAKREADEWLHRFQRTPEAWQTADQLLRTPMQDGGEVCYFVAQTIRTKMWSDFEQLPADSHASLRDSLLSHLTQHADGAGNVLTQLCLALACLAVRMPAWENPIADVHARLGTQHNTTRALVEFLTVLPECATDSKLPVDQPRRRAVSAQLAGSAPQVYELLSHLSRSDASVPSERVLRGFLSWFRLSSYELAPAANDAAGSAARDAAVAEVMRSSNPLVQLAMDELFKPDDDCFEVAVDVSIELVRLLTGESGCDGDEGGGRGGSGEVSLVRQAASLSMLGPLLERLAAQLQAHVLAQDEDAARGLCRLLTEAGEACSPLIANVLAGTLPAGVSAAIDPATAQRAAQLTEALLLCTAHPTAEVAEIAFNFWYVTMLEIASRLEGEQRAAAQRAWTPAYLQLTAALERAMVLPAESEGWSADGFDDFRRFRFACSDGLSDAAKVAGGDVVLGAVVDAVRAGLATLSTTGEWRPLDGALHAAKALSSYVSAHRDEPVASLLSAICVLPLSSAHQLVHSAVMCASGFAAWLHAHPDRLSGVLSFVSASLATGDAQVTPAACVALKNICDACSEQLAAEPWASQLLSLVVGSRELSLASADRAELLAGAGCVYSLLEVERVVRFLEALATPILNRLSQLCADGAAPPPSSEVCALLDQLVALARYCQPSVPEFSEFHPIANMLDASWPVLTTVQRHLHRDSRAMEKLCRVVKFAVRTANAHASSLLPALLGTLSGWFDADAHSCYLYIVHVCASQLAGTSQAVDDAIVAAYMRMSVKVVALLQTPADARAPNLQATLGAHPDVLEDFFELSVVLLARFPSQLLLSERWLPLAQLVAPCALLQHKEAWRASLHFAERLLLACCKRVDMDAQVLAVLDGTVNEVAPLLARELLFGMAGMLPASRVAQSCVVLRAIADCSPELGRVWIRNACAALPPAAQMLAGPMVEAIAPAAPTARAATEREVRRAADHFSDACRNQRLV